MKHKNPAAVALGRLGGKAGTGASKARKVTTEQARAAARARWDGEKRKAESGKSGKRKAKLATWPI